MEMYLICIYNQNILKQGEKYCILFKMFSALNRNLNNQKWGGGVTANIELVSNIFLVIFYV